MGQEKYSWTVGQVVHSMNHGRIHNITYKEESNGNYFVTIELVNDKQEMHVWRRLSNMRDMELIFDLEDIL